MAWWTRRTTTTLAAEQNWMRMGALQAAAIALEGSRQNLIPKPQPWQQELWGFYDELGEFNYGVEWLASRISRIRLRAGRLDPGIDEPVVISEGTPSDLIEELAGNPAAQAEMLATLAVHLAIPGESYMVGETVNGVNYWRVRSSDELVYKNNVMWIVDDDASVSAGKAVMRELADDFLITRVWRPHRRFRYQPTSPALSARSIMRELELVNRHIQAQHLSRLASAGILVMPDEISFPVREAYQDADDPFVAEFIDTARQAIQNPGTAAAIVPIPMRVPSDYIDKIRHVDFTLRYDDQILAKRESAIRRLATKLDLPAAVLLGMQDVNHWTAWQLDEDAIKTHIQPTAEIIMHGLTLGYLHPRMRAMGEDPSNFMVWYDASELTARPDKSKNAGYVYDQMELSGEALRRETGFTEADKPDVAELREIILKRITREPRGGPAVTAALDELTGTQLVVQLPGQAPPPVVLPDEPAVAPIPDGNGPPSTKDNPPPSPGGPPAKAASIAGAQAAATHVLEFTVTGWKLKHPKLCTPKLFSCPYVHVTYDGIPAHPEMPGDYECHLNSNGELEIGARVYPEVGQYITASRGGNGANSSA